MNIKKIKELVEMMNEHGLTEIEVELEGQKIKLVRRPGGVVEHLPQAQVVAQPTRVEEVPQPQENLPAGLKEVQSPMVGTFYSAANPDSEPYVKVGDVVQKGDVVCIVEAMKLMNEVKSDVGGRVREIKVENAEPIEFGQVLFVLEPV